MIITDRFDSDYQIIYPYFPTPSQKFAAQELKKYLNKITGAFVPEYQDNRHEEKKEIVVGYTNRGGFTEAEKEELGEEGFIIRCKDEKIYILGSGVRGALYGVYTFLEKICGCRFYTKDFEKIPTAEKLDIKPFDDIKEIPVFYCRNSYWFSLDNPFISAKLKNNGRHGREKFPDCLGGDINYDGGFCHTIALLTVDEGAKPDFWHQPCLSDEKVYNRVLSRVRKILEDAPDARLVSITQNDGEAGACKCEKCKAVNDREGSEMGTMLAFVNRIAEELEPEYPNVTFDTFAYRFTRTPPKTIRPRKNVTIRLCSIEGCFRHPLAECGESPGYPDCGRKFSDDLKTWTAYCDNLSIWNYTTDYTNFVLMYYNFDALRENERFFAENKVKSVFEQGNLSSANGEFGELRGYLLARLLWDPYMSEEQYRTYMDEFICDYYGEAAPYIKEFFDLCKVSSENEHFGIYFDDAGKYVYCHECPTILEGKIKFAKLANDIFDKAENACKDVFTLGNVRRSRITLLDYIDFTIRDMIAAEENEDKKKELTEKLVENNKKRFEWMRKYGVYSNREFSDITALSDPDYMVHGLLWDDPEKEKEKKKAQEEAAN